MKKLFAFIVLLLTLYGAFAGDVTEYEANIAARNIYHSQHGDTTGGKLVYSSTERYVYQFKQGAVGIRNTSKIKVFEFYIPGKFILMDNNDHPINEYWRSENEKIRASSFLKAGQSNQLNRLKSTLPVTLTVTKTVGPLLTTTWNQEPYYNDLCPFYTTDNERAVTGCVATAMAQIMKYWNWPSTGKGSYSYTDAPPAFSYNYGVQSANFGSTTYNWASMPNGINSTNAAIATLCYHCGVSVAMDYGDDNQDGSGAYVRTAETSGPCAQRAYVNNFNYAASVQGIVQSSYTTAAWATLLEAELDASRVIQYEGFDVNGNGGHTWVCDGYQVMSDGTVLFHMNWGWGGSDNGWFNVTALNVSGFQFNSMDAALIGIQPSGNPTPPGSPCNGSPITFTTPALTDTATASTFPNDSIYSWTIQIGTAAPYTVIGSNKIIITAPYATLVSVTLNKTCKGGTTSQTNGSYTTPSNCGIPTGLTTTTATSPVPSATFSWTPMTGVSSYLIWFGLNASNGGYSTVTVTGNSWKLNFGITAGSSYWWKIRTNCATTGTSAWSDTIRYTIGGTNPPPPPVCSTPTGLTPTGISTTGATLGFTTVSGALSYNLQYRPFGGNWTTITGITGPQSITGLASGTQYNYQVQTVCSSGTSAYSAAGSFTTATPPPPIYPAPTGLTSTTVVTTAFNWSAVSGSTGYSLQYKKTGDANWTTVIPPTNSSTTQSYSIQATPGTTYSWQVAAYYGAVLSAYTAGNSIVTSLFKTKK